MAPRPDVFIATDLESLSLHSLHSRLTIAGLFHELPGSLHPPDELFLAWQQTPELTMNLFRRLPSAEREV